MPSTISALEAHIGYWMRLVSNQVSTAFARKLEGQGVTVAEWVLLREMYRTDGRTAPSAIASLTGLTRGAVSKLVEKLRRKELVIREESKIDRRYQDIELTDLAKRLIPKLARLADLNDDEFFSVLNPSERQILQKLLRKIADAHQFRNPPMT